MGEKLPRSNLMPRSDTVDMRVNSCLFRSCLASILHVLVSHVLPTCRGNEAFITIRNVNGLLSLTRARHPQTCGGCRCMPCTLFARFCCHTAFSCGWCMMFFYQ